MHSSKLRVSVAILGAIFAVSATAAKAIPMGPFPNPNGKVVAEIPMGPFPNPNGKVAEIPMGPFPNPNGKVA